MLCRLNHELLPDPGKPIANTTVPLLARAGAAAAPVPETPTAAGVTGTVWRGAISRVKVSPGKASADPVSADASPGDSCPSEPCPGEVCPATSESAAADSASPASGTAVLDAGRGRDRPRPPRLRRRRVTRGPLADPLAISAAGATGVASMAETGSGADLEAARVSTTGISTGAVAGGVLAA